MRAVHKRMSATGVARSDDSLIQRLSGIVGPAEPYRVAAAMGAAVGACDVHGGDQHDRPVLDRDAIERAIALVGRSDESAIFSGRSASQRLVPVCRMLAMPMKSATKREAGRS